MNENEKPNVAVMLRCCHLLLQESVPICAICGTFYTLKQVFHHIQMKFPTGFLGSFKNNTYLCTVPRWWCAVKPIGWVGWHTEKRRLLSALILTCWNLATSNGSQFRSNGRCPVGWLYIIMYIPPAWGVCVARFDYRAMREPQHVERVTKHRLHVLFMCVLT